MKYIKNIAILLFQSCLLYGNIDNINFLFDSANKLYEEGDYLEANNLYRNIASSNIVSKDLYYNIASSYAEIGSNGYAVLWYERALNISPFDKEIKNNIILLNGKNNQSIIIVIFYLTIILFIIFFTAFIILFVKKIKINKKIYCLSLTLSILSIIPAIISYNLINADYLITVRRANLYNGSSERTDIISRINEGEKFRILEEHRNWYYVKGFSYSKGWINKEFAEKI